MWECGVDEEQREIGSLGRRRDDLRDTEVTTEDLCEDTYTGVPNSNSLR